MYGEILFSNRAISASVWCRLLSGFQTGHVQIEKLSQEGSAIHE